MRCYLRLSVAALLLLLGLGVIYGTLDHLALHDLRWPRPQTHDQHLTAAASLPRTAAPPVRGPRRAVRGEYATEIIWQLPSGSDAPVGLLLMAHGCSHGAYDFWPPTDDCPHCLGLPEEVALVSNGLAQRFMVVTISSLDRKSKCWSGHDGPVVADALNWVAKESGVLNALISTSDNDNAVAPRQAVPVFAFGASSGGTFVSSVLPDAMTKQSSKGTLVLRLAGIACQIAAPIHPEQPALVPTVFLHMAQRDSRTAAKVELTLHSLTRLGVPVKAYQMNSLAIDPDFFARRSAFSLAQSELMVSALEREGLLEPVHHTLLTDPRVASLEHDEDKDLEHGLSRTAPNGWRAALRPLVPRSQDSFIPDESAVAELLNVAYARHEISSDYAAEWMEWLVAKQVSGP